jgi:hypothetical protein
MDSTAWFTLRPESVTEQRAEQLASLGLSLLGLYS